LAPTQLLLDKKRQRQAFLVSKLMSRILLLI
jgi:hypothetical protein